MGKEQYSWGTVSNIVPVGTRILYKGNEYNVLETKIYKDKRINMRNSFVMSNDGEIIRIVQLDDMINKGFITIINSNDKS